MSSSSAVAHGRKSIAVGLSVLILLAGCSDTENLDRDGTRLNPTISTPDSAAASASTTAVSIAPGSAEDWNLTAGPRSVAARIDELSGQDAGIKVSTNGVTVYIYGVAPDWLQGLVKAAEGSDFTVEVKEAKYGQQYLLSAAQELLPQILPLGATSVRPASDLSGLVIAGAKDEKVKTEISALAKDLQYPVEITFA